LGNNLAISLENDTRVKKMNVNVCTVDGKTQVTIGSIKLAVKYQSLTKSIDFIIIPSLTQDIILGTDFWKELQNAPNLVAEIEFVNDAPDLDKNELREKEREVLNSSSVLAGRY